MARREQESDKRHICLQSLSHCELITDDGIRHLGSGPCAHDRLEVIELDNCPLITDASLEHLKSCHSLDRIELYDCQQITRAGIKRLRVSAPLVVELIVWLAVGEASDDACTLVHTQVL